MIRGIVIILGVIFFIECFAQIPGYLKNQNWAPCQGNPLLIMSYDFLSLRFNSDGTIFLPESDKANGTINYAVADSVISLIIDGIVTPFGKIKSIENHFMVLNFIDQSTGQVNNQIPLIFYSDFPTEINISENELSEIIKESSWNMKFYNDELEVTISYDSNKKEQSILFKEDEIYFLKLKWGKIKVASISNEFLEIVGVGEKGISRLERNH